MSLHVESRFTVYQFYVRLRDFRPTAWRRLQVEDRALENLLWTVACAFGLDTEEEVPWKVTRVVPNYAREGERRQRLRADVSLRKIMPLDGTELTLRLAVGKVNAWRFELVFEGMHLSALETEYPICVEGGRGDIPPGIKPCELADMLFAERRQRRRPCTWTPDTPRYDLATFNLTGVNTRLGHYPACRVERRESCHVLRIELSETERQIVFDHGNVDLDERRQILAHATYDALLVYVSEGLALAKSLALAANRAPAGPLQCTLERLSGRFQRHAHAWVREDYEIKRELAYLDGRDYDGLYGSVGNGLVNS